MRILHLCLSNFYIDGAGYQENHLVRQHVRDGHEVLVIASTEMFDGKGGLTYVKPGSYMGTDRAQVVRLPYSRWLPHKVMRKLRLYPGVYALVSQFAPETILFHGCAAMEIATVARYAKANPSVLFYADSHEDTNNSGRNFTSLNVLHRLFYRFSLKRALPQIRKILNVNLDSMDFLHDVYGVPRNRMEFFPLGGVVLAPDEIAQRRQRTRASMGVSDEEFVFLQSGKMTSRKKLADSLTAFADLKGDHLRFWITGLLTDEVKPEVEPLITANPRVSFLGWKSTEELNDFLCAADCYLQPGTQSATMQNALCCGCPVILDDVAGHQPYLPSGAILVRDRAGLLQAMQSAPNQDRRAQALAFASARLDYAALSKRVLQP